VEIQGKNTEIYCIKNNFYEKYLKYIYMYKFLSDKRFGAVMIFGNSFDDCNICIDRWNILIYRTLSCLLKDRHWRVRLVIYLTTYQTFKYPSSAISARESIQKIDNTKGMQGSILS
jgi:hypothetical protein